MHVSNFKLKRTEGKIRNRSEKLKERERKDTLHLLREKSSVHFVRIDTGGSQRLFQRPSRLNRVVETLLRETTTVMR